MRNAFQLTIAALGLSLPARTFLFVERADSKEVTNPSDVDVLFVNPRLAEITLPEAIIRELALRSVSSQETYSEQPTFESLTNFPRHEGRTEGGEYTQTCCGTSTVVIRENRNKGPPRYTSW